MALPFDVRDLMKSGSQFTKEREEPVRLAVLVELDAPDPLLDVVEPGLHPRTATGSVSIDVVEAGRSVVIAPASDAAIAVVGSAAGPLVEAIHAARDARVPVFAVALGPSEQTDDLARRLGMPTEDVVVAAEPAQALLEVAVRVADRVAGKRLALAHNFVVMRRPVAEESVKATAWQNALIGVVTIIPGADLPLMTANQAKMLMQVAAAYGQPLGVDRVKELAAVVGGGFLLRSFARQALTVVPGFGWAVKGGIAFSGTLAMGKAAIKYFEEGADIGRLVQELGGMREEYAGRVGRGVASLRDRRLSRKAARLEASNAPEPVLPPTAERASLPSSDVAGPTGPEGPRG